MIRINEKTHTIEMIQFYDISDIDNTLLDIGESTNALSLKEKWEVLKDTVSEFQFDDFIIEEVYQDRLVSNVTDALACKGLD